VIAASYLFFYVAVCFGVGIALHIRFKRRAELDMGNAYPQYETLFEFLKPTKSAQVYIILFILRRALFAGVLLFISTNFFQVFALNFISLAQIMYLMLLKPFEDPHVNKIEVFNEIVVMICNYHLLFFIDKTISTKLKYMAGWSLDLIIILQFFFNSYLYIKEIGRKFKLYVKGYWYRRRARAAQKYNMELEAEENKASVEKLPSMDSPEPYRLGLEAPVSAKPVFRRDNLLNELQDE
jgi:hypothetical protein